MEVPVCSRQLKADCWLEDLYWVSGRKSDQASGWDQSGAKHEAQGKGYPENIMYFSSLTNS